MASSAALCIALLALGVGAAPASAAGGVTGLVTEAATNIGSYSAILHGSFVGNGEDTHYYFEWGPTASYGNVTPEEDAGSPVTPTKAKLSFSLILLEPSTTYHYRIVAKNGLGTSEGIDKSFTTHPPPPVVTGEAASEVGSDAAVLHATINPNGVGTTYHFEYGTSKCAESVCEHDPLTDVSIGSSASPHFVHAQLGGLTPGATYYWRAVATNSNEQTIFGQEHAFTTYSFEALHTDSCPNAHVRQQTSAALLPDCRAYELVSAAKTGGYDVESNLVPGQSPFAAYPQASGATGTSRLLYGIHSGAIPDVPGEPTDDGLDPYVATRGEEGWSTEYVGVPASDPFALAPFSSSPTGASSDLTAFAFGDEGGCSPCFEGGYTGIPVRFPNGELKQGMVAAEGVPTPPPSAKSDGYIAEDLSANGEHLIFGSTSRFAAGGNDETGDVSIYDRDLKTGETHVVSDDPAGSPLSCVQGVGQCHSPGDKNGIAELAVSANGNRILLGQKVSEDAEGNVYWHLYIEVDDSLHSIDLTPGVLAESGETPRFAEGVLYDGMTSDGSKVFFTTKDSLTTDDTDHSADLYAAEVSTGGQLTLTRLSGGEGGTGNSDSCDPVSNQAHTHWNVLNGETANCGVVPIGGGGVASESGAFYFLSPELLDGTEEPQDGVENAPNLYLAQPGSPPRFVATLESSLNGAPTTFHPFLRNFGAPINPGQIAVDPSNGDVYVTEGDTILKFDSSGKPVLSWGEKGVLAGAPEGEGPLFSNFNGYPERFEGIAVGPGNVLYAAVGGHVWEFAQDGTFITDHQLPGLETINGGFAVNSAGDIYIFNYRSSVVVYSPSFAALGEEITQPYGMPPEYPKYPRNKSFTFDQTTNTIYVLNYKGEVEEYVLEGPATVQGGCTHLCNPTRIVAGGFESAEGIAVDGSDNIYLDQGGSVIELSSNGERVGELIGAGRLESSKHLAVDAAGNVFAANPNQDDVVEFGPSELAPNPRIENAAVVDSVNAPESRHTGDFQVTPSGEFAVFTSTLPLTGFESGGHPQIYRYDASSGGSLTCVSCDLTGAEPTAGAELAVDGLSLTSDGRVFFTTSESLALRDSDGLKDVYEWEALGAGPDSAPCTEASSTFSRVSGGCLGLISSGTSAFDSGLLGVSSDGTDAFFFTRDSLAPQDQNGPLEKVYDARELGGFPYTPPPVACKASDECHGPGSSAPPPPDTHVNTGTGGNFVPPVKLSCKHDFVKKRGKCVRMPDKHHRQKKHHRDKRRQHG